MTKKARTPIAEYEGSLAIELPGEGRPHERDELSDLAIVVAYDRLSAGQTRWRLRALHFDREEWTRSAVRRWWAAHEVRFLAPDQLGEPIPEVCRAYPSPDPSLPTIVLCHRNTPLVAAERQIESLQTGSPQSRREKD